MRAASARKLKSPEPARGQQILEGRVDSLHLDKPEVLKLSIHEQQVAGNAEGFVGC